MTNTYRLILALGLLCASCGWAPGTLQAASFTANPAADAFVATGPTGNLSDNNYGGGGALAVAAAGLPNGEFQSVLRFSLGAARSAFDAQFGAGQWSIQSVSLQLSSSPHSNPVYNDVAAGLFGISLMQNNTWVEGTGNASSPANNGITYNSLQGVYINNTSDQALGTFNFNGGTSGANAYALTLSSSLATDILSGSDVSLRLFAADSVVSYLFSSRAMPVASQPGLIITVVPEPSSLVFLALALASLRFGRPGRSSPRARRG